MTHLAAGPNFVLYAAIVAALVAALFAGLTSIWSIWNAHQVAAKSEANSEKLDELRDNAMATAVETKVSLEAIHLLVNSSLTGAIQAEADAVERELAMMLEVLELKKTMGKEPTAEAMAAIDATRSKIVSLGVDLSDRARKTAIVDEKEKDAKTDGAKLS